MRTRLESLAEAIPLAKRACGQLRDELDRACHAARCVPWPGHVAMARRADFVGWRLEETERFLNALRNERTWLESQTRERTR